MTRVEVEPLLQHVVRGQLRELFNDRGLMRMFRADQDAMPRPPASPGWFDKSMVRRTNVCRLKRAEG
jgi:hypothetical protein